MPEGDTIRRLAERIDRRFAGQRVERCVTRDPRLVGVDLTGAVLREADAHGKHLLIRFDDGRTLHAHLRMDGSWRVGPAATEPEWRRRVELWMEDGRLTGLDLPVRRRRGDGARGPRRRPPRPRPVRARAARPRRGRSTASARPPTNRSPAPCSTSASSPGSATCTPSSCRSSSGCRRSSRSARSTASADLLGLGTAVIRTNAARGPQNTTGPQAARSTTTGSTAIAAAVPVCAARRSTGWDERRSPWRRVTVWCPSCQPLEAARAVDLGRARRLLALHPPAASRRSRALRRRPEPRRGGGRPARSWDDHRVRFLPPGAGRDAALLLETRGIRAFGDGVVSVVLASYLTAARAVGHSASASSSRRRCSARPR